MTQYLVISAILDDESGLVEQLTQLTQHHHGSICDSRMSVLGHTFALIMLVSAKAEDLDQLSAALKQLSETQKFILSTQKTDYLPSEEQGIPYRINVISLDTPGIVHAISKFLSDRNINILSLSTDTLHAAHTGTPMFSVDIIANILELHNIADIKQQFYALCDDKNLDGEIRVKSSH
jgi:glycine cleavage system transcriptional repressor